MISFREINKWIIHSIYIIYHINNWKFVSQLCNAFFCINQRVSMALCLIPQRAFYFVSILVKKEEKIKRGKVDITIPHLNYFPDFASSMILPYHFEFPFLPFLSFWWKANMKSLCWSLYWDLKLFLLVAPWLVKKLACNGCLSKQFFTIIRWESNPLNSFGL